MLMRSHESYLKAKLETGRFSEASSHALGPGPIPARAPCHDPRWPAATVAGSVGALRAMDQGIAGVIQI